MKKRIYSLLSALLCLSLSVAYSQTMYNVVWENLSKVTFSSPTLQRASGASGTGKATSENMLFGNNPSDRAMRNNGYMTYTSNTTNQSKKIGFSVTASENTEITHTIDYGFAFQTNGKVKAFTADESSALYSYSTSEEFWLERHDNEMIFKVGSTELLRVRIDPTEALMLRAELTSNNSTFSGVKVSFNTKRFVIDPIIDNTANTMKMQITGGQSPFEYNWEDGERLQYPDIVIKEKGFAKGLHQLKIKDNNGLEFERYFLLGNNITWGNFSNTSQSGTTLNKTTTTGWGNALSTATIGDDDYFWVQYVADLQAADKAFGLVYTGTSFSQYTHLQAGFLMLSQNQLQVIYQGNVVLTTEYNDRDALLISNDGKGLQWMVNGKAIYQQAANFTNDLKVGGLLKDNASMNKVSVFNINHKPLLSSWDATTLSGSVTANIASLTNGNSPYHYYISSEPIKPLYDIYTFTRDSIFDDTLNVPDSLSFFQGSHLPTTTEFVFDGLESGKYFVSVFDKQGLLLLGGQINVVQAFAVYNTTGITLNTNLLTSTANNAKTDLNYFIDDELQQSSIDFTAMNASEKYSMGLSDFNTTTIAIQYGFFVNSKTVKFYVNGTLESTKYSVKNNNILTLEKNGSTLYYKINGVVMKQTTLSGTYLLKTQLELAKAGTTVKAEPKTPTKKLYKMLNLSGNSTCESPYNLLSFKITPIPAASHFTYSISHLLSGTSYQAPTTVSNTPGTTPTASFSNIPFGVYHIQGNYSIGGVTYYIDEAIDLGIEGDFFPVINYAFVPNTFSLVKNSTSGTARTLSSNTLKAEETGWVSFTGVNSGNSNISYFSFTPAFNMYYPGVETYVSIYTPLSGNSYQFNFYSAGTLMYTRNFEQNARIRAFIKENTIQFYSNTLPVSPPLAFTRTQDIHVKTLTEKINNGFENIVFSFTCEKYLAYVKLEIELSAGHYIAYDSKIGLYFDEEYGIDPGKTIPMKLFNKSHQQLYAVDLDGAGTLPSLPYKENENKHILDLRSLNLNDNEFYTLEVTTVSGEKRYLKFLNKN